MIEMNPDIERKGDFVDMPNPLYEDRGMTVMDPKLDPKTGACFEKEEKESFDKMKRLFKKLRGGEAGEDYDFFCFLSDEAGEIAETISRLSLWFFEVRVGDVEVLRMQDFIPGKVYLAPFGVESSHKYHFERFEYEDGLGWRGVFEEDGRGGDLYFQESYWRLMRDPDDPDGEKRRVEEIDFIQGLLGDDHGVESWNPREVGWRSEIYSELMCHLVAHQKTLSRALKFLDQIIPRLG